MFRRIMGKSSSERVADKIIALLADSLIRKSDWRLWIPRYLLEDESREIVVANAKHLADGINEIMEQEQIAISPALNLDYLDREI